MVNPSPDQSGGSNSNGGSTASAAASASSSKPHATSLTAEQAAYVPLWEMDTPQVDKWIRSVHALFPANKSEATTTTATSKATTSPATIAIANALWQNLQVSIDQLAAIEAPKNEDDDDEDDEPEQASPPMKRRKANGGNKQPIVKKKKKVMLTIQDPYNTWLHTIRTKNDNAHEKNNNDEDDEDNDEDEDDDFNLEETMHEAAEEIKLSTGGKLSQLRVSGLINGMAGVLGGVVDRYNKPLPNHAPLAVEGVTMSKLIALAMALHQSIETRIQEDVLVTTPIRIQTMLSPDLQPHEFKAIRRRIYDTVILGKGLANQAAVASELEDIPTAASTGVHDIEKFKKCKSCGNKDQSLFVLDRKNGDVICSNCGTVASESLMHEGSQFRKFEGEVDRNHHGDAANPLYSNAHNMSTTLGGVQVTTGAGIGGFGSQKKGLENILRNAHAFTELNISQFGKGERRTRTGYKDKQKKDAFLQMTHCGDALNLHEAVVQRAKELFAGFRDDRELVQQFKGVIAACLCEAFDQLSSNGRQILKQQQVDETSPLEEASSQARYHSARANRRKGLHHANLAGKGGLKLDYSAVAAAKDEKKKEDAESSSVSFKPAPKWNLEDCRSWLLEASRSIAQQWMQERNKNPNTTTIPSGSLDELEGKLVEHSITLCDKLEQELKQSATQSSSSSSTGLGAARAKSKRVVTPRVNDMAKLGIRWQHAHERGSGGKGGVGNSGTSTKKSLQAGAAAAAAAGGNSGKTAGQVLILKTAKKLGALLGDVVAGNAIHKELRILVGKQDARKRKEMRDEAARQRLLQMKRKPWLQARAQIET